MKSISQTLSQGTITQLKKLLSYYKIIVACYLFGSQTKDSQHKESDLDLAIFVEDRDKFNEFDLLGVLAKTAVRYDIDLSVVDLTSSPFLLYQIIKNGVCLYERSYGERIGFEAKVLHIYYDSQHLRNTYYFYLDKRIREGRYGRR